MGWTIGGIVGVFVVGALLNLLNNIGPSHSPHRSAWASLRDLASAEAEFRSHDRDGNGINDFWVGDVSQLYLRKGHGEQIRLIELSLAMADASAWAPLPDTCARNGYRYAAIKMDESGEPFDRGGGLNAQKFGFCAFPEHYRMDVCRFSFIVNEGNVIWKKDLGGASVVQWPKDHAAEGWVQVIDKSSLH